MKENNLIEFLIWVIGFIIVLTVGSNMINQKIIVPILPEIVTIIFGWFIIIATILTLILEIFNK